MSCFKPINGYYSVCEGKRKFFFSRQRPGDELGAVPCGQCVGCRLERSRQWAVRIMHEASLYEENCFVTLTYSDENLPLGNSLNVRDFQLFMKKLRKEISPRKVRFFNCAEYGENFQRPHFHTLFFGIDFRNEKCLDFNMRVQNSEILARTWEKGFHKIGDLNFQSAAYVARYVIKKVVGEKADDFYLDKETGLLRKPEFVNMSRRPGIGRTWLERYSSETYPSDAVIVNGRPQRPPRYYDIQYGVGRESDLEEIKKKRRERLNMDEVTPERLLARQAVAEARLKLKKRGYENA